MATLTDSNTASTLRDPVQVPVGGDSLAFPGPQELGHRMHEDESESLTHYQHLELCL